MQILKFSLFIASVIAIGSVSGAQSKSVCEGFIPPNDMKIPVGDKSVKGVRNNGGLTEAQFNSIMDRIQVMYGDMLKQKGKTLVINRLWNDATVNASAQQQGNNYIINMYGGLARHPDIILEGMALVACHEMGHHLGGAPKINQIFGGAWATNEGGADYFSTLKCLRVFFENDDNAGIVSQNTIDATAKAKCMSQFTSQKEQDLCMRISMAAESSAYFFQAAKKEPTRPKFDTPDMSKVNKTNDDHPATQCRMDTYFAGAICNKPVSDQLSDSDFKAGSCVEGVDAIGFRSRCWFQPESGGGGGGGGGGECPLGDPELCKLMCQLDPSQPYCQTYY